MNRFAKFIKDRYPKSTRICTVTLISARGMTWCWASAACDTKQCVRRIVGSGVHPEVKIKLVLQYSYKERRIRITMLKYILYVSVSCPYHRCSTTTTMVGWLGSKQKLPNFFKMHFFYKKIFFLTIMTTTNHEKNKNHREYSNCRKLTGISFLTCSLVVWMIVWSRSTNKTSLRCFNRLAWSAKPWARAT